MNDNLPPGVTLAMVDASQGPDFPRHIRCNKCETLVHEDEDMLELGDGRRLCKDCAVCILCNEAATVRCEECGYLHCAKCTLVMEKGGRMMVRCVDCAGGDL